jgi:hypothetical protein
MLYAKILCICHNLLLPPMMFHLCGSFVIMQGEHKRTLHFQNYTENKCGILRTSHLHQSIEKLSKFCTHLTETRYVLHESHDRCRDNNPSGPKLCALSLGFWRLLFMVAANHDLLGVLIFVGCVGSKPEHGPQLHQTQRADQDC